MQVDSNFSLLPGMSSTNTAGKGVQVIGEESNFQAALQDAQSKLESAQKSTVMTPEEVAKRDAEIKAASVQLEAIMLKLMYGEMWKTVPKDKLFGDDNAMEIYRDMYNEELTKQMAEGGGIGLANFIYEQLTRTVK